MAVRDAIEPQQLERLRTAAADDVVDTLVAADPEAMSHERWRRTSKHATSSCAARDRA